MEWWESELGQILKLGQPKSTQIKGGSNFLWVFPELLENWFPKAVLLEHKNLNKHSEVDQEQKIYKQISPLPQMSLLGRPLPSVTPSTLQIRDLLGCNKFHCLPLLLSATVKAQWGVCSWVPPHSLLVLLSTCLSHLHITSNSPLCVFSSFQERNNFPKPPQAALNLVQQPKQRKSK